MVLLFLGIPLTLFLNVEKSKYFLLVIDVACFKLLVIPTLCFIVFYYIYSNHLPFSDNWKLFLLFPNLMEMSVCSVEFPVARPATTGAPTPRRFPPRLLCRCSPSTRCTSSSAGRAAPPPPSRSLRTAPDQSRALPEVLPLPLL